MTAASGPDGYGHTALRTMITAKGFCAADQVHGMSRSALAEASIETGPGAEERTWGVFYIGDGGKVEVDFD